MTDAPPGRCTRAYVADDYRESTMLPTFQRAIGLATLSFGLFLITGASSHDDERSISAPTTATAAQVELTDWIEVCRAQPILAEPLLGADTQLANVAANVAAFTQLSSGLAGVDTDLLEDHLAQSFPNSRQSLSTLATEYFWYIDENGTPIRVCVGVEELSLTLAGPGGAIVVRIRRQLAL